MQSFNTKKTQEQNADGSSSENAKIDSKTMTNADCPFMVKVGIPDLNIRKGAGTNTGKTGKYTGIDVFTIVEVRSGKGSDAGWGKLEG